MSLLQVASIKRDDKEGEIRKNNKGISVHTWLMIIVVNIVLILVTWGIYKESRTSLVEIVLYFMIVALIGNIFIGYGNLENTHREKENIAERRLKRNDGRN